jgi:hypothetical protein
MQIPRGRYLILAVIVVSIPNFVVASAHADPLGIPGYTVTDLGPGTPAFSTDANGNGVLNAPNGQIYAFPQASSSVLTPGQGIMANFPLDIAAPMHPANGFAVVQNATMTTNGTVVATEVYGIGGQWSEGVAYTVQLNANGSWGSPVTLWNGNEQIPDSRYANVITGVNQLGQVLGSMGVDPTYERGTDAMLYSVKSQTSTDLTQLFLSSEESQRWSVTYNDLQPIAIEVL